MKFGVIDIGSNSVRLLISDGKIFSDKDVVTTRLAEGMSDDFKLKAEAMQRTVAALSFLCEKARAQSVDVLYVFATAAVRKASNRKEFLDMVYDACGVNVDVLSGGQEAEAGYTGALNGLDGGVIDVGGASTEVIVIKDRAPIYEKSVDVGAVSVKDICGQDSSAVKRYLEKRIIEYGVIPPTDYVAIGGTATTIAAILQQLDPYDPKKVDGFCVTIEQLSMLEEKLFSMSVEERKKLKGLREDRAEIIAGGVSILSAVAKLVGAKKITVSEKDNLEGYLKIKTENL
jgi:exopolyphosphatase/guanosine-5'-triphosphate,3'-diphosphate pyrophosphatase